MLPAATLLPPPGAARRGAGLLLRAGSSARYRPCACPPGHQVAQRGACSHASSCTCGVMRVVLAAATVLLASDVMRMWQGWADAITHTTCSTLKATPCCCSTAHSAQVRLIGGTWLLLDLEQAAYAARRLPACYRLADWDDHTLEPVQQASAASQSRPEQASASQAADSAQEVVYTPASDMYQLGKMLRRSGVGDLSPAASAFIASLVTKQLTAREALQHPWLQQQQQ